VVLEKNIRSVVALNLERVNKMADEIFKAQLIWQPQDKPFTYADYSRFYLIRMPGKPDVLGTSAPAFAGSAYHPNPEDMLVAALSACHMLTYLAIAAKSKILVLAYEDNAEGILGKAEDGKMKLLKVILRPKVTLAAGAEMTRAALLHEKAHANCFIANSINFPVEFETDTILSA
jgi:organic hydroperoxide reductase OsmC/OhrA